MLALRPGCNWGSLGEVNPTAVAIVLDAVVVGCRRRRRLEAG
jgi:hypothetical protein